MSSKMVTDLHKLSALVTASNSDRDRNDKAMQGLLARCADVVPEGTTSATVGEALFYLGEQIAFETEALRRFDDEHVGRLVDLDGERKARNEALSATYDVILRTRRAFELIHGPGTGTILLGLDTTVPDDPRRLYHMADRCRRWLRDPERLLPEVQLKAFAFDRERAASDLDGPVGRLEQALHALPSELKSSVDTLAGKFAAMQRLDKLVGQSARYTEALYDLAGMEFQSDRLRPTSHRASSSGPASPPAGDGEAPAPNGDGDSGSPREGGSGGDASSPGEAAPPSEGDGSSPAPPEGTPADGRHGSASPSDGSANG